MLDYRTNDGTNQFKKKKVMQHAKNNHATRPR